MTYRVVVIALLVAVIVGSGFWFSTSKNDMHSGEVLAQSKTQEPIAVSPFFGNESASADSNEPSHVDGYSHEESSVAAALRKISPRSYEYFTTAAATYIEVIEGKIGTVDASGIKNQDTRSLIELVSAHAVLTAPPEDIALEIVELRESNDTFTAIYRQRIRDIPVDMSSKIRFDSQGNVLQLSSLLVNPQSIVTEPTILLAEAETHAKNALATHVGVSSDGVRVLPFGGIKTKPSTLFYGLEGADSAPAPYWKIYVMPSAGGPTFVAKVDAQSGETQVFSTVLYFETIVCKDDEAAAPVCADISDPPSSVIEVFEENSAGDAVCVGAQSDCNDAANRNPWDVLDNLEVMLEGMAPTLCCDSAGANGTVHVMTKEDIGNEYPPWSSSRHTRIS